MKTFGKDVLEITTNEFLAIKSNRLAGVSLKRNGLVGHVYDPALGYREAMDVPAEVIDKVVDFIIEPVYVNAPFLLPNRFRDLDTGKGFT
jgi:hypothetical protein